MGYNILQPSSPVPVLDNDLNEPGASWNFASLSVVTPPSFGRITLDAATGTFLYTQNSQPLPPGGPPMPYPQDSFTYNVTNSLGHQTNTATVVLSPVAAEKAGYIVAHPDIAFTRSLQPIIIDLLANDELRIDPTKPLQPGENSNLHFDFASVKLAEGSSPQHGKVTFDPTTGALTYTPDFGYVGWDRFDYQVSTTVGLPNEPFPGQSFSSGDEVFVIIDGGPPRLQADPQGGQMLVVDGTHQPDTIAIAPGDRRGEIKAVVNGVASPSFRPTSRIVALGYGGNDTIVVSPLVRNTAWLVGGEGNDLLMAGGGSSVLLGGDGNDVLLGGLGRDLLIGGAGADSLASGFAGDILVGGSTRFDAQPDVLGEIFRHWAGSSSSQHRHGKRVDRLTSADVLDDGAKDTLVGRRGADQIFATSTGVADDVIRRRDRTEREWHHDRDELWGKFGKRRGSYSLMESLS